MFISHRLKFAFFRVPKTGSTTMGFMLRMADKFDDDDILTGIVRGQFKAVNTPDLRSSVNQGQSVALRQQAATVVHATPEEAVNLGYITHDQLVEYKVFVCCREPFDRYWSAFNHVHRLVPTVTQFAIDIETGADYGLVLRPQVDYAYSQGIMVADVLDFSDYVLEIRRMLAYLGGDIFPVIPNMNVNRRPLYNENPGQDSYWTPELKAIVQAKFTEDFAFHNAMKAGTL